MVSSSEQAFLLIRQWRETTSGVELVFWAKAASGPIRIQITQQEAVCFAVRGHVAAPRAGARSRPLELLTLEGALVDALYFPTQRALVDARRELRAAGVRLYESDVKPSDRYLMERFITGGPRITGEWEAHDGYRLYHNPRIASCDYRPDLSILSLDIETDADAGVLFSIGASTEMTAHVFLLRSSNWDSFEHGARIDDEVEHSVHHDELSLIEAFFSWLKDIDPDIIIGWNVIDFDLHFLERRCERLNLPFAFGRGRDRATLLEPTAPGGKRVARLHGRAVLDGIDTLRNAMWSFEDFGLDAVARELLGWGKLIEDESSDRIGEIKRLYREAPSELMRYNLEDCRLVEGIFEKTHLVDFSLERAELTGLALDRVGGSVAAFDSLYLPRFHRRGRVARDVEERPLDDLSPGGHVMDSEPGLFRNVIVLDFKSLYPSIIRTFLVDPLGLAEAGEDSVPGFKGGKFSRDAHILPGIIEHLWSVRDKAKRAGHVATSRAIKIIMNSFYGVLGTPACRFFEPRLASSITLRGHEIITKSRAFIESEGYRVIYGDTDSLFVLLDEAKAEKRCLALGSELAKRLTAFWSKRLKEEHRLDSYLEVELEAHYLRFFHAHHPRLGAR